MEIVACRGCGKLFNYIRGARMCPACSKQLEEKFTEVKKYVRENPNVDINTISKEMEVSIRQINQWVREERLVFSDESPVGIPCERCGTTIKSGKYCASCRGSLGSELSDAAGLNRAPVEQTKKKSPTSNRMRFLDN